MKKFEEPVANIQKLMVEDVITTSFGGNTGENETEEDRDE